VSGRGKGGQVGGAPTGLRGAGLVGEAGICSPATVYMQALREFYPTSGLS
jgi:hypothetical protein